MIDFRSVIRIDALWAYEGGSYVYKAIPESLAVSDDAKSIRFELREINGEDNNVEIVIQEKDGSCFLRSDYYQEPERAYPLEEFASANETVFYFYRSTEDIAYFHLSSTERTRK